MNRTVRFHRLAAVASALLVFVAVIAAIALLSPAPRQAVASGPVSKGLITPPAPPPINPPIQTPEPGVSVTVQSGGGSAGVNAIPFRPKAYITRGQPPVTSQGVEKPPASENKPEGHTVAPQAAYIPPDLSAQVWIPVLQEDFSSFSPPGLGTAFPPAVGTSNWTVYDFSPLPYVATWGATFWPGYWAGWPAAFTNNPELDPSTGYTNSLNSWLDYGPINLSNMTDFYVSFQLWYDTEPSYDWVYFCVSTDGNDYTCDYWSGYSGGWLDQSYWLTSYAGYSTVYVAWIFQSDSTISGDYDYYGPYLDNIYVWADNTPPAAPPPPDQDGLLIQNGGFESDLSSWNTIQSSSLGAAGGQSSARAELTALDEPEGDVGAAVVGIDTTTYVEGAKSAYLWNPATGSDFLHQTIPITPGINAVVVDYWFALPTFETTRGRDYFCASLRDDNGGPIYDAPILVDLGCLDPLDATDHWQESIFTLTSAQIAALTGNPRPVVLLFEMYNTGGSGTGTALYVDYVRLYATGAGSGATIDSHEPNNDPASATTGLACPSGTITGTVGDALGGYDIDWFRLNSVPAGTLQLDIDAQTKVQDPRSTLDSILRLWDASGTQMLAYNDDDGVTFDSFISYTVSGGTYYVSVESYTGAGGPTAYYDLNAACSASAAPPEGGNVQEPPADTWTVMLYLNGEDANFTSILNQYKTGIEGFVGSKQPWLKVVILYDGPGGDGSTASKTFRYLVQPNANYTLGVNKWDMGELNMGDPDTLANFVSWAMTAYPAENYYLAIDDHGDGAYGTSWDTSPAPGNKPQLTPPEIYSALKDATQNGARTIDIVDFESCLMGLTENVYDIRQWADYVVFSQQISWGISTYPVYFSDLQADDTPLEVGERIVERYSAGSLALHRPHTISFVDASKFTALQSAVTAFGDALVATGNTSLVFQARNASQAFAASNDATNPAFAEYIDLWDFAAQVKTRFASNSAVTAAATAVQNAVDEAVVAERHYSGGLVIGSTTYNWNHNRAHGLSIYYPVDQGSSVFGDPGNPTDASYAVAPYLYQMSQDGRWDEFLLWAVPASGARGGSGRPMGASRAALKDFNLSIGSTFVTFPLYLPLVLK